MLAVLLSFFLILPSLSSGRELFEGLESISGSIVFRNNSCNIDSIQTLVAPWLTEYYHLHETTSFTSSFNTETNGNDTLLICYYIIENTESASAVALIESKHQQLTLNTTVIMEEFHCNADVGTLIFVVKSPTTSPDTDDVDMWIFITVILLAVVLVATTMYLCLEHQADEEYEYKEPVYFKNHAGLSYPYFAQLFTHKTGNSAEETVEGLDLEPSESTTNSKSGDEEMIVGSYKQREACGFHNNHKSFGDISDLDDRWEEEEVSKQVTLPSKPFPSMFLETQHERHPSSYSREPDPDLSCCSGTELPSHDEGLPYPKKKSEAWTDSSFTNNLGSVWDDAREIRDSVASVPGIWV